MSKRLTRTIFVLAVVSLTIGVAAMAGAQGRNNEFRASMKGSNESPKGPSSASGTFTVEFKNGQACFKMSVKGLGAFPVAAHIHRGAAGTNGPIVVDLKATAKSTWKGTSPRVAQKCVSARAATGSGIRRNPGNFYANVHTPKNPARAAPRRTPGICSATVPPPKTPPAPPGGQPKPDNTDPVVPPASTPRRRGRGGLLTGRGSADGGPAGAPREERAVQPQQDHHADDG